MKATIDRSGCISCGLCTENCPEVFQMAEDGLAEVASQPTAETIATAKAAAEGCPVAVITVEE